MIKAQPEIPTPDAASPGPTPGPYFHEPIPADWHTDPDSGFRKDSLFMIVDSRSAGEVIAVVEQVAGGFDEAQANARMLAASWELREALKKAVETIRAFHDIGVYSRSKHDDDAAWALYQQSPEMQQINAALAKAEGR